MDRAISWRSTASLAVVLTLGAPLAHAQSFVPPASSLPPAPSVVGREILDADPAAPRKARPEIVVPGGAGLAVPPELAARQVLFRDIVIEGATAFNKRDIDPIFAPLLNRRVPFAEVAAAVNRVTALYEKGGYALYSVVLPQQDLDGDRLRVVVIEGTVSRIEIGPGIASPKVRAHIEALTRSLVGHHPLRRAELERRLLLAAETPGLMLRATVKADPSGDPAQVVLVLDGTFERFSPIAQIDSFQTLPDTTVNFRVGVIGRSLAFGGDALEVRYLSAWPWNRLQMGDVRYGVPLGSNGDRLDLLGQAVWQRPLTTLNGQPLDFLGRSLLGRAQYSHPFVRHLNWSLVGLAMLDVIEVDYQFVGIGIPGDSLRVLRSGVTASVLDDLGGVWTGTLLASIGLDVAAAAANGRLGAQPGFAKANVTVQRLQPLGGSLAVMLRASAQGTTGTMPASEVFAYGGRDYGRAFTVAESVGDRGAAVLAELRHVPNWLGLPASIIAPEVYVFGDHGWLGATNSLNAPYFAEGSSVGAGLRIRAWEKWAGEVELAKVVSTPVVGDRPLRASVRFGTRF